MSVPALLREHDFPGIAAQLVSQGWSCCENFLPAKLIARLRTEARQLVASGELRPAAIGPRRTLHSDIRGDETRWLDAPYSPSAAVLIERLEELRGEINAGLQLGLFELELHFARYRPGAAYGRHLDRFAGSTRRVLSLVLYLNEEWRAEHGGALRLYPANRECTIDFAPQTGRLVLFLSERFEHEVMLTTRERLSITGWFLTRTS
jgi:SM-20-related protein